LPEKRGKRPRSVTVIAWVWIITGVLMVVSSVVLLLAYTMVKKMAAGQPFPPAMPAELEALLPLFGHVGLSISIQLASAVITLVAGIAFLKLRAWARTTIEAICWLSLLYVVGLGIYGTFSLAGLAGNMPRGALPVSGGAFTAVAVVAGIVVTAVFAVPLAVMIRSLRGREIREAVRKD
jgi:hypothetical protein